MHFIKQKIKKIPVLGAALQKIYGVGRSRVLAPAWAPRFSEEEMLAAERLALPENAAFGVMVQELEQIEGNVFAVFDGGNEHALGLQVFRWLEGGISEIGFGLRGKSAALLGRRFGGV